jgi:hypothetical protein
MYGVGYPIMDKVLAGIAVRPSRLDYKMTAV